jgi:hypothetical protein
MYFTDIKEDPDCVMMQSSAKTCESLTRGTDDQSCNNDKTPNIEEKLQEVEKVRVTYKHLYCGMNFNVAGKEPRLHCMMLHAAFSEVTLSLE